MADNKNQTNAIILASIFWGVGLLALLIVLGFRECRSVDDNINKCIEAGKYPRDCACAYGYDGKKCR